MEVTLQYLLFFYWIFPSVETNGTELSDDCERQVLVASSRSLIQLCGTTGKFQKLGVGDFQKISYSPRDGGTILAKMGRKLVAFVQTNAVDAAWTPHTVMDLQSLPQPCDRQSSASLSDMAIDWATGIVYATYSKCGKIRAYDWKRSLFGLVHDEAYGYPTSIATYSRGGLLIWVQKSAILRALLDGTEVEVLVDILPYSITNLAVDQKTALVYWTQRNTNEIFQCDLQGNNKQKLKLFVGGVSSFTVLDNIMFWTGDHRSSVRRSDIREPPILTVFSVVGSTNDLEIFPGKRALNDSIENQCANNSCSHICVRSNNLMGQTCPCRDDYAFDKDGHNCTFVRRNLLVSTTMEGIWQIPILDSKASEPKLVVKNALNATGVQCDVVRRKILWAEKDNLSTRIWQVDMESPQTYPEVVFEHFATFRVRHEELEALAVDWRTGNLYMAFRDEQRILACGRGNESTKYSKCAELFGNQVGSNIGGLVVVPLQGTIYWTRMDDEDPAVVRGGMDGSWMEILKRGGQPRSLTVDTLFRVYWLNSIPEQFRYFDPNEKFGSRGNFQALKYKSYTPQRITVDGNNLYWAGLPNGSSGSSETIFKAIFDTYGKLQGRIEKYVDTEFINVSGLRMCDVAFGWKIRTKAVGCGFQCSGLCLLNGTDSFRCVCPIGYRSHGTNGSSCKEMEEPTIIYSTVNGSIKMKDGINEKLIYEGNFSVSAMAFDPVKRELFWFLDLGYREGNRTFSLIMNANHSDRTNAAPRPFHFQFKGDTKWDWEYAAIQLEYDWIGENLFFLNSRGGVGLCSTATGECTITLLSRVRRIALDPPNGYLYWALSDYLGIWRGHMDGSVGTILIPRAYTEALSVDHTSKLLFWRYPESSITEVFHSDLDGKNIKSTVRLYVAGRQIHVAGSRLWMNVGAHSRNTGGFLSCDKKSGDNFKTHELGQRGLEIGGVSGFVIMNPSTQVPAGKDACIQGGLCSHMCIPTPSGYMRCLCPTGYKLMSNGWTCECANRSICNTPTPNQPPPHPSQANANSKEATQVACSGSEFPCVGKCVGVDKFCNGFPDCQDFSDEGERCHETCKDEYGCSHRCSRSPTGPICFCPPDQTLASDNKSCTVIRVRTETVGLIASGVVGLVLLTVVILVTWKYQQTKRERDLTQEELDEFRLGDQVAASVAPDGVDRALLLPFTKVIQPEDIIIACFWVRACKLLKHSVDVDEFKAVLAEVKIMEYLGDHAFIVKFLGAEISEVCKRKIMIVTELSPKGDLLKYLWKAASVSLEIPPGMYENAAGNPSAVTNLTLCTWCEQIAAAMEYLAQKQIVHGDLAARNVLVFRDNVVKIADFGLSKQLYGCSTYQMKRERKLPWKWSAIELLTSREFSEASDVWAFGVTAWEKFTLGQTPYKGIMFGNEFIKYIQVGNRLPKPEHASEEIYKVLLECWDSESSNRPSFNQLKEIFHGFVSEQRGCERLVLNAMGSEYVAAV